MSVNAAPIEGYESCRECGEWFPSGRGHLCDSCRGSIKELVDQAKVAYEVEGRVYTVSNKPPKKPKKQGKQYLTPRAMELQRKRNRAKTRAMVRLTHIYEPMYRILLDEERIAQGLEPMWKSGEPKPVGLHDQLEADIADAAERGRLRFLE